MSAIDRFARQLAQEWWAIAWAPEHHVGHRACPGCEVPPSPCPRRCPGVLHNDYVPEPDDDGVERDAHRRCCDVCGEVDAE